MHPAERKPLLHRFFAGVTEATFHGRLGVVDPPLVQYLTELLVRFVQIDMIFRVRNLIGQRLDQVVDMVAEGEQRVGNARREVHRHIGDFTLFWTGIYPEALRRMKSALCKDHFVDYCQQGKRSYYIASTYRDGDLAEESSVLERLSQQFELCAYGLSEVRKQWEQDDDAPPLQPLLIE
jgi:hypothetical protein